MFTPLQLNASTPRSQKRSRHGGRLSQLFRLSHQDVNLDIDMVKKSVSGVTEIAITPTSSSLRTIKLDCREMKISSVTVNNRRTNYIHQDLLYINNPKDFDKKVESSCINIFDLYSRELTIHQHHIIRQKLNYLFGDVNFDPREPSTEVQNGNTEELKIILPENFRFEQSDRFDSPDLGHDSGTPAHLRKSTHSSAYAPIIVRVKYSVKNPQNGLHFVTGDKIDVKNWHVYTTNSEFNISTSSWVPCIDNLWDKCSWTIELDIPRTTKELERVITPPDNTSRHETRPAAIEPEAEQADNENGEVEMEDNELTNDNNEDRNLDDEEYLDLVVCAGDLDNYNELPHPSKRSRKIVSWSIFNPISAHHVGFAIGPFLAHVVSDDSNEAPVDDDDEANDTEKDSSRAPLTINALQSDLERAKLTCKVLSGALDYFLAEYGSFPFTSYTVTFVHGVATDVSNFAGLSILSDRILFTQGLIEPLFKNTELLIDTLAEQWSGINITPQQFGDMWVTIGISKYMSLNYIRQLMGQNECRYRIKMRKVQAADDDVGKKPLAYQFYQYPLSTTDLSFVSLKALVVLFILDKRMTKTDKSFGLSRVLPKIFLQSMSGDLQNSTLSTLHFQYVCEKVNRNKLETFFKQWVFNAGVPLFSVAQRFNKKRSIVEMQIRQIQLQIIRKVKPNSNNFIEESIAYLDDEPSYIVQPVFTGPMTLRIHEANGTPYEHIIDLKHETSKLDIQYNTKFRRSKKKTGEDQQDHVSSFKQLGDVLQSKAEMEEWNLVEWIKDEDDPLFNDAFEWLRVDADFEWISKMSVKQPDYMFASQLQYDRDVEAQYDAVRFFATREKPTRNYCTVLTRTVMDERYFYGVRIASARALAGLSKTNNQFMGLEYLIKIFRTLYCFPGSNVPKSNDFSDFAAYFLKKELVAILASIRDDDGNSPTEVKRFLLSLLKYNDNSNNDFQDCYYVAELIKAITSCAIITGDLRDIADVYDETKQKFVEDAIVEINRLHKLDEWVPSYHNVISQVCLQLKILLAIHGYLEMPFDMLIQYTQQKFPAVVRAEAFKGLFQLGGLRNAAVMKYFLNTYLLTLEDALFKRSLMEALLSAISWVATGPAPSTLDDPEFEFYRSLESDRLRVGPNKTNMMVIEDSIDLSKTRQELFAKSSTEGAIGLLRSNFAHGEGLKTTLWELLHSSLSTLYEKRRLFNLCQILFEEKDVFLVRLPVHNMPIEDFNKKIVAKNIGDSTVVIKREGRFKIQLARLVSVEQFDRKKRKYSTGDEVEYEAPKKRPVIRFTNKSKPEAHPIAEVEEVTELPRVGLVAIDGTLVNIKLSLRTLRSLAKARPPPAAVPVVVANTRPVTLRFSLAASRQVLSNLASGGERKRYIKILTKEGRVEISSEPFEEVMAGDETGATVKVEEEQDGKPKDVNDVYEETLSSPTASGEPSEPSKPREPTGTFEPAESSEPDESAARVADISPKPELSEPAVPAAPLSRSVSPFDQGPSQVRGYHKKKAQVYIHKTPSPPADKPETDAKKEEPAEKPVAEDIAAAETAQEAPKPKLKLKLGRKK